MVCLFKDGSKLCVAVFVFKIFNVCECVVCMCVMACVVCVHAFVV